MRKEFALCGNGRQLWMPIWMEGMRLRFPPAVLIARGKLQLQLQWLRLMATVWVWLANSPLSAFPILRHFPPTPRTNRRWVCQSRCFCFCFCFCVVAFPPGLNLIQMLRLLFQLLIPMLIRLLCVLIFVSLFALLHFHLKLAIKYANGCVVRCIIFPSHLSLLFIFLPRAAKVIYLCIIAHTPCYFAGKKKGRF